MFASFNLYHLIKWNIYFIKISNRLKLKISSCYVLVSISYFIYEYAYVGSEATMDQLYLNVREIFKSYSKAIKIKTINIFKIKIAVCH
nr:hypothetical protein GGBNIMDK_00091 [Bacillus cereus]